MRTALAAFILSGAFAPLANAETVAAFAMPASVENWQPDILGQNGVYRFRQADGGCQITFAQNRGVDAARAAGQKPEDTLDAYIGNLAGKVAGLARRDTSFLELPSGGGETIRFLSQEITYTGNDKVAYSNRISVQWVGGVELLVIAACPSDDWKESQTALASFLGKVSVSRVSQP